MLQSGKMRVSGLDLGHTIADVKTTFSSENPPISALYYSVSGLTTPHSIHTPPQAVSVGVYPLLGVGAGPLWSCWPSRRSVRGGPW